MVIEIKKSDDEKYKDTLRVSKLLPFEYVILSKDEYKNPLTGEGTYGEWAKYNVKVHEYKTTNPQTGETATMTPNEVVGWFASGKSLIPKLPSIEVGQQFKVTQIQVEGKSYSMYKVELINADGTLTEVRAESNSASSSSTPAPKKEIKKTEEPVQTLDDKIKVMKEGNIPTESFAKILAIEFDTTEEFVTKRVEVL